MLSSSIGAAGRGVLQHRRAEGAELGGDGVAVFRGLVDRAADALADRRRFAHGGRAEVTQVGVGQDAVDGGAGDRAHRVHRQVAPQLVPDVLAHVVGVRELEAGVGQQVGHRLRARAAATARFADDQPWPRWCCTSPGSGLAVLACTTQPITCDAGSAAAITPPGSTLCSGRVAQHGHALAEPPGHAVHRRQQQGLRADQRRQRRRQRGQCRALDGDHHQVLHTQVGGAVRSRPGPASAPRPGAGASRAAAGPAAWPRAPVR
jgi:hypothetical protein